MYNGAECLDMYGREIRNDGKTLTLNEKETWTQLDDAVMSYYDGME